jgi:hypothetical protein
MFSENLADSFARMALVGDPQIEGDNRLWLGYYGMYLKFDSNCP